MKRFIRIILTMSVLLMAACLPAHAHGWHMGGGMYVGPGWWGSPYQYYYQPPVVIEQQPDTYTYQAPQEDEEPTYWYLCKDPEGYYPYVKECPNGWLKVVPPPNPEDEEEE